MALPSGLGGSTDVPYSPNLNISAGTLGTTGTYNIGTGANTLGATIPQQQDISALLRALSTGTYTSGVGGATNVQELLNSLGLTNAATGALGINTATDALSKTGSAATPQAQDLVKSGITTETTGMLPASAQTYLAQKLNEQQQQIRGKYASLGQSGSSAEQEELTNAQNNSVAMQFQLATTLGGQEVSQGISELQQGTGATRAAGDLQATLANLGFTGLSTSGNIGTTLAQLGISGLSLSQSDLTNIANEALQQMQIGQQGVIGSANIYNDLATKQLAQDNALTATIQAFFGAIAKASNPAGGGGSAPAGQASPG